MAVRQFEITELTRRLWKNGAGLTREIISYPPGASWDDFDWRVSIADIHASGLFSCFSGCDRVITLLEGSGMLLEQRELGLKHELVHLYRPWRFCGDKVTHCNLKGDSCTDFNVITRKTKRQAEVLVLEDDRQVSVMSSEGTLYVCHGRAFGYQHDSLPFELFQGQGVWWCDEANTQISINTDQGAVVLLVIITKNEPT